MFLSKRSNGYYYIYFDNNLGKKNKVSTKTKFKKEALEFLTSFKKEYHNSFTNGIKNIDLKSFLIEYYKFSSSYHQPKTTKAIKGIFNEVINFLTNPSLLNIGEKDIRRYLAYKSEVSNYTAQKHLAHLRSAFNYAKKNKYIKVNPCAEIENYRIPEKQPKFFSEVEYQILLNTIGDKRFQDLVEIAVNTGLRQMELITLQWDQVNFKDRFITLNNRNHITKGKKLRSIPLNLKALQILNELELSRTNELIGKKLTQDYVSKKFKNYVKKIKINPQLNFHSLKHSFASWLVQRGVGIYQVSKLLGHADIKTTEIYAHLRAEDLRESVEMLK
jgi:site-specific recombinase XerD